MQTSQVSLTLTLTRSLTLTLIVTLTLSILTLPLRLRLPILLLTIHPGQVELFAVSSMDESNVALFHPHPTRSGLGLAELLGPAKPRPNPHWVSVSEP